MGIEPQIVYLAQQGTKMTVSVAGNRILVRHMTSETEQLREFEDAAETAQAFASTLQDLVKRKWDLDPEASPNPAPLPAETVLELEPPEDKNWRRLTRVRPTDIIIPGSLRLNGRKADALDPEERENMVERVRADGRSIVHIVEGGGELLFSMAAARLDSVEKLVVDSFTVARARQAALELGDISYVLSELPALEIAVVVGAYDGVEFDSQTLAELHLHADPMHQSVVAALARGGLPSLRALSLSLSSENDADPDTEEVLRGLLQSGEALPALRDLAIEGTSDPDGFLRAILDSPYLAQLDVIHVGDEIEDDDAVAALLAERAGELAGKRLELDLPTEMVPDLDLYEPRSRLLPTEYLPRVSTLPEQLEP